MNTSTAAHSSTAAQHSVTSTSTDQHPPARSSHPPTHNHGGAPTSTATTAAHQHASMAWQHTSTPASPTLSTAGRWRYGSPAHDSHANDNWQHGGALTDTAIHPPTRRVTHHTASQPPARRPQSAAQHYDGTVVHPPKRRRTSTAAQGHTIMALHPPNVLSWRHQHDRPATSLPRHGGTPTSTAIPAAH